LVKRRLGFIFFVRRSGQNGAVAGGVDAENDFGTRRALDAQA